MSDWVGGLAAGILQAYDRSIWVDSVSFEVYISRQLQFICIIAGLNHLLSTLATTQCAIEARVNMLHALWRM